MKLNAFEFRAIHTSALPPGAVCDESCMHGSEAEAESDMIRRP